MEAKIPQIAALTIFVCLTVGVAALGQQPPMPVGLNPTAYGVAGCTELGLPGSPSRIPAQLRTAQSYGAFSDPYGFGSIPEPPEMKR